MQEVSDLRQERRKPARVIELLHEVLATRANVGQHWGRSRQTVKVVEAQCHVTPPGHGDQVDDGIRRATECDDDGDGVEESPSIHDFGHLEVLAHHLHDAGAARGGHSVMCRIHGRDGGGTG